MKKGIFIVFEGIDGSGKSTQASLLASELERRGMKVARTAEPTAELESGKALRRVLSGKDKKDECETALMFALDRVAHNVDGDIGIEKLLSKGYVIICDRYYYSSLAYQGSATDYEWVKAINVGCPKIRRPDLCLFFDLLPEESMRRISGGRESTEIYENVETLTKVRNSFMRVIEDLGGRDRIRVIDGADTVENVFAKVLSEVEQIL